LQYEKLHSKSRAVSVVAEKFQKVHKENFPTRILRVDFPPLPGEKKSFYPVPRGGEYCVVFLYVGEVERGITPGLGASLSGEKGGLRKRVRGKDSAF